MWLNRNCFMLVSAAASDTPIVPSCIILGSIFISPFKLNGITDWACSTSAFNYTGFEQKTRAFLETLQRQGGPPIYTLSPEKARVVLSKLQAATLVAMPSADIENRTIPEGPNGNMSINIVQPEESNGTLLPVVMYFHGGWWVHLAVLIHYMGYFDSAKYILPIMKIWEATNFVCLRVFSCY